MYINSEYKDLFYEFIRNSDSQPSTIKNIRSDINSLFLWLDAVGYIVSVEKLVGTYRSYLINSHTPVNTMNRRLSSTNKFVGWVLMNSNGSGMSKSPDSLVENTSDIQIKSRMLQHFPLRVSIFIFIILITLLGGSFLAFQTANKDTSRKTVARSFNGADYRIQFDLLFNDKYSAIDKSNSIFKFNFYSGSSELYSIGQVQCPVSNATLFEGSSRLRINLDSNCTPLQPDLLAAISRNEAIYVDIFLNTRKLSNSKISIKNSIPLKAESNYQNSLVPHNSEVSNSDMGLPNISNFNDILGLQTVSTASASLETIPLSAFLNVSTLDDGDIVTLFNNQLIRALLSTKVLGVKSSDSIITKGVTYIHILNSSDVRIEPGDYITTSAIAGYGQKAMNAYDTVVGIALEASKPGNSYLKVLVTTQ